MFLSALIIVIFVLTPLMIRNMIIRKDNIHQTYFIYLILAGLVFLLTDAIWGSDNVVAYTIFCGYLVFLSFFIIIPVYIIRYLSTSHSPEKDKDYLILFIIFSIAGLLGTDLYLEHTRIIEVFLTNPLIILIAVFLPFIPILICLYYRDRR